MSARKVSPSRPFALSALGLAVAALGGTAWAQTDDPGQRIEVTGSLIKRLADEGALPVSTIRATELSARGHTELKDFMLELPQASSLGSFAGTAGPITNLRGFGPMRTLTLLNGRRLAKEPLTSQYVSVSVMPRMALQRVDILRDGASSAYGSDAISGVQAFHTFKSYEGLLVKAEGLVPEKSGGGDYYSAGFIGGLGNMARDGWNFYGAMEYQRRKILLREERPELISGAALGQLGINTAPQLGANATPANFTDPTNPVVANRTIRYNPYFASGCLPPYSEPSTASGRQTCFLDTNDTYSAFGNGNDIISAHARGSLRLGGDHVLSLEYNLGKYTVLQNNAATAVTVRLTNTHPYYPGNGIVPAVAAANLGGRPIDALWSVADLGVREREDFHTNQRVVLALEGRLFGWDYQIGANHGWSERDTRAGKGWTTVTGVATVQGTAATLFLNPALNPFGLQDAAGLAVLRAASLEGQTLRLHRATNTSGDATISGEVFTLPGGSAVLAVGGELRRDGWKAIGLASNDPKASLNNQVDILGGDSQAQGANSSTSNYRTRGIISVFTELEMPVLKDLSFNLSVRGDQYRDLEQTSVNPKASFRFQATKQVVLRGSANTGFRAPAIPEIYSKETELTSLGTAFDDPLLCTQVNGVDTPAAGYTVEQVCNLSGRFQITKVPGNSGVKPEKSRAYTLGLAVEPVKGLSASLDYWHTQIDDVIGNRNINFMVANYALYADLFRRNADGTLQANAVFNVPTNLGAMRGSGWDFGARYAFREAGIGQISLGLDIAYLLRWDARTVEANNGDWVSALAQYNDVVPVNPNVGLSNATRGFNNRWRHTASVAWSDGPYFVQLSQRYQSKFRDQNLAARTGAGTSGPRDVASYEQYNLYASWEAVKNLKLALAVSNLLDRDPPQTNHNGYNGYVTSSVDVLGRAYMLSAQYKF